jgi:hypothetical protein
MKKLRKDLFGNPIVEKGSHLERSLRKYDRDSFGNRLDRLKYLQKIFPKGYGFLLAPESAYILDEVKMTFMNGHYVATIMLAQAFIEHVLQGTVCGSKSEKVVKRGLGAIVKWIRNNKPEHSYLMKEIDHLRKFRNPFCHLRPSDDPDTISQRMFQSGMHPDEILEEETKKAITLMYEIAVRKF